MIVCSCSSVSQHRDLYANETPCTHLPWYILPTAIDCYWPWLTFHIWLKKVKSVGLTPFQQQEASKLMRLHIHTHPGTPSPLPLTVTGLDLLFMLGWTMFCAFSCVHTSAMTTRPTAINCHWPWPTFHNWLNNILSERLAPSLEHRGLYANETSYIRHDTLCPLLSVVADIYLILCNRGLTLKAPVTTIVVCFVICLWF